jgi:O-succinylbenzoate synthase
MAVADAHLRAAGRSLAHLLGVDAASVPVGAVAGVVDDDDTLVEEVAALVEAGYSRVKLKIAPGRDVGPVGAVRRRFPGLILQADANAGYRDGDIDHLVALDRFGLACLEQPFARDDLAAHAALARRSSTPVCLDESADSPEAVRRAVALGACDVVCVKPARLGGVGAALVVHRDCAAAGIPLWVGGMFESGYARSVNAVLAGLPGFSMVGDLAPATVALAEDLVPAPELRGPPLRVGLHRDPGMGPAPDGGTVDRLARTVTRHPA